jgi:hypothetical protein
MRLVGCEEREEAYYDELQVQTDIVTNMQTRCDVCRGANGCGKDINGAGTVARATTTGPSINQSIMKQRGREIWRHGAGAELRCYCATLHSVIITCLWVTVRQSGSDL